MAENDFNFLLEDRKQKIAQQYEELNLAEKGYIAFSGGKDSMILSALFDMAVPENKIPRVFCNTGIEYTMQVKHVKALAEKDARIVMLHPTKNVRETLEAVGYPFKSKFHSHMLYTLRLSGATDSVRKYFTSDKHAPSVCPLILRYQLENPLPFPVSDRCCREFKKKIFTPYEKRTGRRIAVTGMRQAEGGKREGLNCLSYKRGEVRHFNPLSPLPDWWCDCFVDTFDIRLSPLYYEPFNFKRTGCRGCPYNMKLSEDLQTLAMFAPSEAKAAMSLWKPVYDEYVRIGYRLKSAPALQGELDL